MKVVVMSVLVVFFDFGGNILIHKWLEIGTKFTQIYTDCKNLPQSLLARDHFIAEAPENQKQINSSVNLKRLIIFLKKPT